MTALKDAVRKAPRPAVASEGKKRLAALIAEAAEKEIPLGGAVEGRPDIEALLVGHQEVGGVELAVHREVRGAQAPVGPQRPPVVPPIHLDERSADEGR